MLGGSGLGPGLTGFRGQGRGLRWGTRGCAAGGDHQRQERQSEETELFLHDEHSSSKSNPENPWFGEEYPGALGWIEAGRFL